MNVVPEAHPHLREIVRLREYVRQDKPKKLREGFTFKEPLRHGWLLPYLIGLDDLSWGRWEHWSKCMFRGSIGDEPIPQIEFSQTHSQGPGRKMLETCLRATTKHGDWAGWGSWTYFDYFLDWLLFALGDETQKEHPKTHSDCEGASERLYQLFNLEPLLAFPYDHWGDILAENNYGRRSGFFPTPIDVCSMMVKMQMDGEDCRTKTVCDPCVGTGRMLLPASNYSYRLYAQDISPTVLKACRVNLWLYAPWGIKPFPFLEAEAALQKATEAINDMKTEPIPQKELPGAEEVFNLAGQETQDGERVQAESRAKEQARKEAEEKQLALL